MIYGAQYAFIGWAVVETKDFSWHASLCDVKMESGDTKYLPSFFCGSKGWCCVVVRALGRAGHTQLTAVAAPIPLYVWTQVSVCKSNA